MAKHVDFKDAGIRYKWKNKKSEGWIKIGNVRSWLNKHIPHLDNESPIWGIGGSIKW